MTFGRYEIWKKLDEQTKTFVMFNPIFQKKNNASNLIFLAILIHSIFEILHLNNKIKQQQYISFEYIQYLHTTVSSLAIICI